jgi:hypothetical protein
LLYRFTVDKKIDDIQKITVLTIDQLKEKKESIPDNRYAAMESLRYQIGTLLCKAFESKEIDKLKSLD